MLPSLAAAREQARRTQCSAHLRSLGLALETVKTEYEFYPFWDDGGTPIRYTWIDILIQQRALGSGVTGSPLRESNAGARARQIRDQARVGYCPSDSLPDLRNQARHPDLIHPRSGGPGIDYSYGIGAPLSSGGWARRTPNAVGNAAPTGFRDTLPSARILAGDAVESVIFNLSGDALLSDSIHSGNYYDNTVAWQRHGNPAAARGGANFLFQDGHVGHRSFVANDPLPINTSLTFVWQQGEALNVNPTSSPYQGFSYPGTPPMTVSEGGFFPDRLFPNWYTTNELWTMIRHK